MQTTSRSASLLLRQIKDIQAQADRIMNGEHSAENIEQFARYSQELKKYALDKFRGTAAEPAIHDLPEIFYLRNKITIAHVVMFSWFSILAQERQARARSLEEIREARNKYASLEFVLRDLLG